VDIYSGWLVWQCKEPSKKAPTNLVLPSGIWLCRGCQAFDKHQYVEKKQSPHRFSYIPITILTGKRNES
jgi:hypothetical protein